MAGETLEFEAAMSLVDKLAQRLAETGSARHAADRQLLNEARAFLARHKRVGARFG